MASSVKPKSTTFTAFRAPSSGSTGPARPELLPSARALALGAAIAAPAPLNTPSRRREQPTTGERTSSPAGPRWGSPGKEMDVPAAPLDARPAAVKDDNVWAAGHVAERLLHPKKPEAPIRIKATGRWGDDEVEQDIARRDKEREQRRNREFPDLKEAAVIEEHRHEMEHQERRHDRFQRDDRFDRPHAQERYRDDRFDGVDRGFSDLPRREGGAGLTGRWARDFNAQPSDPKPSHVNPRFSPSDARFDTGAAPRNAPPVRARPAADNGIEARDRYPSPPHYANVPDDPHQHHEPNSEQPQDPEKHSADAAQVEPAVDQNKAEEQANGHQEQPVADHEEMTPPADEHSIQSPQKPAARFTQSAEEHHHFSPTTTRMDDRHRNDSLSRYHDFRAPVWSHPARFDDPEDFHDPLNWRERPHESTRNSHRRTPKPNESIERERKMSSLSHTSSSSSSTDKQHASASSDAQMRILKRDAPKMLFDPKTGSMVTAEKEDKRKPQQQQSEQEPTSQIAATKQEQAEAEEETVTETAALPQGGGSSEVDSRIATLVVGDVEVPIHDVPVLPVSLPIADTSEVQSPMTNGSVDKSRPRSRGGVKHKKAKAQGDRAHPGTHRSRSASVASDKQASKRGDHGSASASPSLSQSDAARPKRSDHQSSKDRKGDFKKNRDDRKESGAIGDSKVRQQRAKSENLGRKAEAQSTRSTRRSQREAKHDAHKDSPSTEHNDGFQTAKPRRVVLIEKKQSRHEGSPPTKVEDGSAEAVKPKRESGRRGDTAEIHVGDISATDGAHKPRGKRSERRQEHHSNGRQSSDSPDKTRKKDPEAFGSKPQRNKSPSTTKGEQPVSANPADQKSRPERKRPQRIARVVSATESPVEIKNAGTKDKNGMPGDDQRKDKPDAHEQMVKAGVKPRRTVVRKVYVPKAAVAAPSLAAA